MAKYIKKPEIIEAVLFDGTEKTINEIIDFAEVTSIQRMVDNSGDIRSISISSQWSLITLLKGCYLVKDSRGNFSTVPEQDFETEYVPYEEKEEYKSLNLFKGGDTVDSAYKKLQEYSKVMGRKIKASFKTAELTSDDSLDECYIKITGMTKAMFENKLREESENYKRRHLEYLEKLPQIKEEIIREADKYIIPGKRKEWLKMLGHLLKGTYEDYVPRMVIELLSIMRNDDENLTRTLEAFNAQGHSGATAAITEYLIENFFKGGDRLREILESKEKEKE